MCGIGIPKHFSRRPTARFVCSILFPIPFLVRLVRVLEIHGILVAPSTPPPSSTPILIVATTTRTKDMGFGCRTRRGIQSSRSDNPLGCHGSESMDDSGPSIHSTIDPIPIQSMDIRIHASTIPSLCCGLYHHYPGQDVPLEGT